MAANPIRSLISPPPASSRRPTGGTVVRRSPGSSTSIRSAATSSRKSAPKRVLPRLSVPSLGLSGPIPSLERIFERWVIFCLIFAVAAPVTLIVLPGLVTAIGFGLAGLALGTILGLRPGLADLPKIGPYILVGALACVALSVPLVFLLIPGLLFDWAIGLAGLVLGLRVAPRHPVAPVSAATQPVKNSGTGLTVSSRP